MDKFLNSIACSGTECLSWILVFVNILAVFYLVFCSFWKISRAAKITGWIWCAGLLCATVGVLIAHTCVYTLLATIFTAMMIMAILAVILPQPQTEESEQKQENKKHLGFYVVTKTDDERYAFCLYDAAKRFIVKSKYSYESMDAVKQAICVCRDNGMMAVTNDKTRSWILDDVYPSFEAYAQDGQYRFCLKINDEYVMLDSEGYDDVKLCEKALEKTKTTIATKSVYLNTEIANGKGYAWFESKEEPVEPIEKEETRVEQETITEDEKVDEQAIEEVVATATVEDAAYEAVEEIEQTVIEETPANETVETVEAEESAPLDDVAAMVDDVTAASEAFVVGDEIIYVTYNRSFTAKLIQASDEVKERYSALKTALSEYGAKSRMSWANESFYTGRVTVAKLAIRGKTLSLYLALNPVEYEETKYVFENAGDVKKYAQVPMRMKIRSNRSVKWAKELIAEMMTKLGKEKTEIEEIVFDSPFKPTEDLVHEGLIKVYTNGDGAETEVTAADFEALRREKFKRIAAASVMSGNEDALKATVEAPTEAPTFEGGEGEAYGVVFNADVKTLWSKYAELSKEQRGYFDRIREYSAGKDDVKCIESKDYLTFKYGKDKLVRLRIRRSVVEAVFMLVGSAFKNTFSASDVKIRDAATIIRVENDQYLDVALKTVDMEYVALVEERARRIEERKARRRKQRPVEE